MTKSEAVNCLAAFCGVRDIEELTPDALYNQAGVAQADVMVLFGGSILCGGEVLARGIQSKIARKYMIVGGAGHTTPVLRSKLHTAFPEIETENRSEAELFNAYLHIHYGLSADLLETESTNCGNNITYMLNMLDSQQIPCHSIILVQDATMQRRMAAGLRLLQPDMTIINFAAYQADVIEENGQLQYKNEIWGMWEIDHYVELLLGEIQRLRDDRDGYGPKGRGYIAHEDIPADVEEAFAVIGTAFPIRRANPAFASKTLERGNDA